MKKFAIFLFFIIIIQIAYSQDFRKSEWGDSQEKVLASEKGTPKDKTKDYILYSATIAGMEAYACYYFIEDQLVKGLYIISIDHSNLSLYYEDYIKFQELLIEKYGDFANEEKNYTSDYYEKEPDLIGDAIRFGKVKLITTWETETAIIDLETNSDDGVIIVISYWSIKHMDLINKKATEGL